MRLYLRPSGSITSRFGVYRDAGYNHTGIDFVAGYKAPRRALRDGLVYKVKNKDNFDPQQYRNVYQICDTPIGPMEVAYVHCWDIIVNEGDRVKMGDVIYTEGNTGTEVYSGGKKVTVEEKPSGKGSHLHCSVRPVKRTKYKLTGEHYLRDKDGSYYQDEHNNYYQIKHSDNQTKGWVDWSVWMYSHTETQKILILQRLVELYKKLIHILSSNK